MNAIVYNSLMEYFDRERLTEGQGDLVSTLGFESENDGGAANYIIESTSETANNELVFSGDSVICRGFKLRLLPENGVVYVEQFGAKGNYDLSKYSDTDKSEFYAANSNAIRLALNSGCPTVAFANKTYMVSGGIAVTKPVNVLGHSATLQLGENNSSVISVGFQSSVLEDVRISDLTLKGISTSHNCTLLYADNVGNFTVDNIKFNTGCVALNIFSSGETPYGIRISNCKATNVKYGFDLLNVCDFKIQNCSIELSDDFESVGLILSEGCGLGTVEDLSIINASESAIDYYGNGIAWSGLAVERILFKNLLVTDCNYAVRVYSSEIPLHFANMMMVDVDYGVYLEGARNVTVANSSILIKAPVNAVADAAPICVREYAQAKFTHTQFDFPRSFSDISTYDIGEACELSFVDCTIQKTDVFGAAGVISPCGFGNIGDTHTLAAQSITVFDACEFRSNIQEHIIKDEYENITGYNFPMELYAAPNNGSKLIIKNCRFVNETSCDVPYFILRDGFSPDNIVVYNCFFENYDGTEDGGSTFPIFGRLVNGNIEISNKDSDNNNNIHNIFAKSNMRSSKPTRETGTTINEMLEYI